MQAVLVLSGEEGSGRSTLLRALLERYPREFRFQTLVTTRPCRTNDVAHPLNRSFSEYCYVSDKTFDFWIDQKAICLAQESVRKSNGGRFGILLSTLDNTMTFDGYVIANVPPACFLEMHGYYRNYGTPVHGVYLDVPQDLLHERRIRCGYTLEQRQAVMLEQARWREQAERLGYTLIENPDEDDGVPRRALASLLEAIGWEE